MPARAPEQLRKTIESLYRSESGRVLATLVRLLGDLDLAEEAMHEAFAAALEFWSQTGIPDKPRPWLISTARFKAIDVIRRRARFDGARRDLVTHMESRVNDASGENEETGVVPTVAECASRRLPHPSSRAAAYRARSPVYAAASPSEPVAP